jgi:hypothetical protein
MRIRRFNESKEEDLEEYFIDFIDYGFSYTNQLNKFFLKLNIKDKQVDFSEIYSMYDMVINRLLDTKGISKTVFEFKETVINVMIEIANKMTDEDTIIKVIFKGQELKLKPFGVRIYSYVSHSNNSSLASSGNIYSITLECYDINNIKKVITWNIKNGSHVTDQLTKENSVVRIGSNNIKIDIENSLIIYNIIKDGNLEQLFVNPEGLELFKILITPEILSNI